MKICFVETEPDEGEFFAAEFSRHDLNFSDGISDVGNEVEVLSTFIYSAITTSFLEAHPLLRMVATRSTTADHIDVQACSQRGITVCNVPSYGDYTVAEHVLMLLLAVARRLREVMDVSGRRTFSYEAIRGVELRGKTLGVDRHRSHRVAYGCAG